MIHHVSIPAQNPERVASVLAELTGGRVVPFGGAAKGSFLVIVNDGNGTAIEVLADDLILVPGEGEQQVRFRRQEASPSYSSTHFLLSVKAGREKIEEIGAREGWRTRHFWRGPDKVTKDFELVEVWIENRILIEMVSETMVSRYIAHMSAAE